MRRTNNANVIAMVTKLAKIISHLTEHSTQDRKLIAASMHEILSTDFQRSSLVVSRKLELLQELVFKDFCLHKDRSLIEVLIQHKLSPIHSEILEERRFSEEEEAAALVLKRFIRSANRSKLHLGIFGETANTKNTLSFDAVPEPRIKRIIYELASNNAIINRYIHHWTTLPNFKNILRNGAFYGSQHLDALGLLYQKNALTGSDVKNGDGNVICCCPYLVDYVALLEKKENDPNLRDQLLRLTLDLNKIETQGEHNQFFKLFDLLAPDFDHIVKITKEFEIRFVKLRQHHHMEVVFILHGKAHLAKIYKADAIFYGNLYHINQFCLLKLFSLVANTRAYNDIKPFKDEFNQYLKSLDDNDIKKLLIVFAQHLTMYAEYNFNATLPMTNHLITEIYFCATSTLASLHNLSSEEYSERLCELVWDKLNLPAIKIPPIVEKSNSDSITFYGRKITFMNESYPHYPKPDDFTAIAGSHFSQDRFIETRMGAEVLLTELTTESSAHLTL